MIPTFSNNQLAAAVAEMWPPVSAPAVPAAEPPKVAATAMQLVSLQTDEARCLNQAKFVIFVSIRNTAFVGANNEFPGGFVALHENAFWQATMMVVPAIKVGRSVQVGIVVRPKVGFKTVGELDVNTRFELFGRDRQPVACAGCFSTDGAVWHKSIVEFSGDVYYAKPSAPLRSTLNVLFVGTTAHAGVSTLINTCLTTLSYSKFPLSVAPTACSGPRETVALGTPVRVVSYTPTHVASGALAGDVDPEDDASCVRFLELTSGQLVLPLQLRDVAAGSYDSGVAGTDGDRKCDALVFVVPASLLGADAPAPDVALMLYQFQQLGQICANPLIAITQISAAHQTDACTAARTRFGVPASRVFAAPAYVDEPKREPGIEKACLALLTSATRQAALNQTRR